MAPIETYKRVKHCVSRRCVKELFGAVTHPRVDSYYASVEVVSFQGLRAANVFAVQQIRLEYAGVTTVNLGVTQLEFFSYEVHGNIKAVLLLIRDCRIVVV